MKKNIGYILFVIFTLFLAQGVVYGFEEQSIELQDVASQDAMEPEAPCPGESFLVFFAKFADDETIQREFTTYPLTKLDLDIDAKPEPEPFIRYLARYQIKFPVFPLKQEREEVPFKIMTQLSHIKIVCRTLKNQ